MSGMVLASLGIGIGLSLALAGVIPQRLTLRAAMAQLAPRQSSRPCHSGSRAGVAYRAAGKGLSYAIARYPRYGRAVISDMAITSKERDSFAMKCLGYGLIFALLEICVSQAMGVAGVSMPAGTEVFMLVASAGLGLVLPVADLKAEAAKRRAHLVYVLGVYVSMVTMLMAGSMGWSSALEAATSVSSDEWAMGEFRAALVWSQASGLSPWKGFARLAELYRVPELATVARSLEQAGDGASIRESLGSIAKAMKERQAVQEENAAQATTQRMLLPGVLVMLGYCVLVFYPAMAQFASARF